MLVVDPLDINSSYLKYLPRIGSANRDMALPCVGDSCNLLVGLMILCFGGDDNTNPLFSTAPLSANRLPNCNSSHRLPPNILFSATNIVLHNDKEREIYVVSCGSRWTECYEWFSSFCATENKSGLMEYGYMELEKERNREIARHTGYIIAGRAIIHAHSSPFQCVHCHPDCTPFSCPFSRSIN